VGTSPADTSGIMLPADVQAAADQAAALTPAATPGGPAATPLPIPGGVSAFPVDFCTDLQIVVTPPACPQSGLPTNISLMACAKILNSDGSITNSQFPISFPSASGAYFSSDLAPGYLLSLVITCLTPGITSGQLFCVAGLCHQISPQQPLDALLISAYLSSHNPVAWPGGLLQDVSDGQGFVGVQALSNPPAGVFPTITVVDAYLSLQGIQFTLVTSAIAGNRQVYTYVAGAGGGNITIYKSTFLQPPSTTMTYWLAPELTEQTDSTGTAHDGPISLGITLSQGGVVVVGAVGFAGNDQFSNILVTGRMWL